MRCHSVLEAVGRTPLIELKNIERIYGVEAKLFVKAESMNPAGSVKDRVAAEILKDAEASGRIDAETVLIEPTSGNTGIGLAAMAAARGYRLVIVMPDSMSLERRQLIAAYGAELVLTDGKAGMPGAIAKAEELRKEIENSFICGQFVNPANPAAHYKTTGPEIWEDTEGEVDVFVAGVGTGGTITGVGRYLKERKPGVKIIAVEPSASPVLSGGESGPHKIQGIGAGFKPEILDDAAYDEVWPVGEGAAYEFARVLARREGILAGVSAGAALAAAVKAALMAGPGKTVVALLPDTGDRYLSCGLFGE